MKWLMDWFQGETKLLQLADRLAAGCQEQVWRLTERQALAMSPAEARGYVRARAGLVVKRAVTASVARNAELAPSTDRLRDLATEQVIRLISAQLRALRPAQRTRKAA